MPQTFIKPKYETNLGDIGIDIGEQPMPVEVKREVPPAISLNELTPPQGTQNPPGSGKRHRRKRHGGGGGGVDHSGLRQALGSALNPAPEPQGEDSSFAKASENEYDEEPDRRS